MKREAADSIDSFPFGACASPTARTSGEEPGGAEASAAEKASRGDGKRRQSRGPQVGGGAEATDEGEGDGDGGVESEVEGEGDDEDGEVEVAR